MRKVLAVLLLCVPGWATANIVQSAKKVSQTTNNWTLAFGSNLAAGHLIGACTGWSGTNTSSTPTDTLGHTYTQWGAELDSSNGAASRIKCYYNCNSSAGADTVTFPYSATPGDSFGVIFEYSGIATSLCLDTTGTATQPGAASTTATSGSVTPTTADSLILDFNGDEGIAWTATSGTLTIAQTDSSGSLGFGWRTTTSTSATTDSMTLSSSSNSWAMYTAVFKGSGGGGATPVPKLTIMGVGQ